MARTTHVLLAALLVPAVAGAQGKAVVEIGTSLGLSIASSGGQTVTHFGVPGQGILGQPTIYASFFAGKTMVIEPQIALNIISSEGETFTAVGLGGQLGYFFKGTAVKSPFLAAALGFQTASGGGNTDSDVGLGAKFGYRVLLGRSVGVRFEAGYRRWFDTHLNEFTFGIGFGGIVHRSQ